MSKYNENPLAFIIKNKEGKIRRGLIFIVALFVVNIALVVAGDNTSFEAMFILRELYYFTLFLPIIIFIIINALKETKNLNVEDEKQKRIYFALIAVVTAISIFVVCFGFYKLINSIRDVLSPKVTISAAVNDISIMWKSAEIVKLSDGKTYSLLYNGYSVNEGETYSFRIMEKSNYAVCLGKAKE